MDPFPAHLIPFKPASGLTELVQNFHRSALLAGAQLAPHHETDKLDFFLAVVLYQGINRLGILAGDSDIVLVDQGKMCPRIAGFVLQLVGLSAEAEAHATPVLAHEFHRLAAGPDLTLPHARLIHDPVGNQIFVRSNRTDMNYR